MKRELDLSTKEEVFSMVFDLVIQESVAGKSGEEVLQNCYQIIKCLQDVDDESELNSDIDYMKSVLPLVVSKVAQESFS